MSISHFFLVFALIHANCALMDHHKSMAINNGLKPNGDCGPIQLSLYGIDVFKFGIGFGRKLNLDEWIKLRHNAIRVCGIEFHFGYENNVTLCEEPEEGTERIVCTNELRPELAKAEENGKVKMKIRPRLRLEFGKIVPNLKTFPTKPIGVAMLFDEDNHPMHNNLALDELVQRVLNEQLRTGQQEFPMVEQTGEGQFGVHLADGGRLHFALPEGLRTAEQWNERVDRMAEGTGDDESNSLFGTLLNLSKSGGSGASGTYAYGHYNMLTNNCVDFARDLVRRLSPAQKCRWHPSMQELGVVNALRAITNAFHRRRDSGGGARPGPMVEPPIEMRMVELELERRRQNEDQRVDANLALPVEAENKIGRRPTAKEPNRTAPGNTPIQASSKPNKGRRRFMAPIGQQKCDRGKVRYKKCIDFSHCSFDARNTSKGWAILRKGDCALLTPFGKNNFILASQKGKKHRKLVTIYEAMCCKEMRGQ